jgi:hypothetical protein
MDTFLDSFPPHKDATSHPAAIKGIDPSVDLVYSTITPIPVKKVGKARRIPNAASEPAASGAKDTPFILSSGF